jgi:hypothetical protein
MHNEKHKNRKTKNTTLTRRQFLGKTATTASASAVFNIVPRHVLGGKNFTSPSEVIRMAGIDQSTPNLGSRVSNTTFTSPEYKRLKNEFVRLRTFQEAWIPIIKEGGFSRFALYDLKADPLQKKDISKQRPAVTNRLKKKLLTLYKDVMADAPDWPSK